MMVPRQPGTLGGVWPFSGGVSRGTHTCQTHTHTRTHTHCTYSKSNKLTKGVLHPNFYLYTGTVNTNIHTDVHPTKNGGNNKIINLATKKKKETKTHKNMHSIALKRVVPKVIVRTLRCNILRKLNKHNFFFSF